jgi:hypothetical protein
MDCKQQTLTQAYLAILSDLPPHWLDLSQSHEVDFAKLSGLFLPGTSAAYEQASRRIMLVGRETRKWRIVNKDSPFLSLDEYIQRAMAIQQSELDKYLNAPADKGCSFFNFARALTSDHGQDGIAWANLFSFAWNGKSPMQWKKHLPTLIDVSCRLLKAQIEILEPDIIIFANGASSARIRQQYFPHKGEASVCSELGDYREQGIARNQLWQFCLNGKVQCYRIQHPSSVSKDSRAARRFLLDILQVNNCGQPPRVETGQPLTSCI